MKREGPTRHDTQRMRIAEIRKLIEAQGDTLKIPAKTKRLRDDAAARVGRGA